MFHKLEKSVLLPTDFHIIRGILEVFMLTKFRKDQKHNNLATLYKTCFNPHGAYQSPAIETEKLLALKSLNTS